MGQQEIKPQGPPPKSLKQQVKEYTKQMNTMRREYQRQRMKIDYQRKTLQKQLKRKIQKKQSPQSLKLTGQQILRNNQMLQKYDKIDAQIQNITFELQQMCVNQSMQNVMSGMAKIMSGANSKMKTGDYQETMKRFMTQKERMNIMNEMVQDIMEGDNEQIQDEDVDKLINDMTKQQAAKKKQKVTQQMNLDDYENNLNDI